MISGEDGGRKNKVFQSVDDHSVWITIGAESSTLRIICVGISPLSVPPSILSIINPILLPSSVNSPSYNYINSIDLDALYLYTTLV